MNVIFCSDEFLLKLNVQFLELDTLTDIITFDYSDSGGPISGEIYISIDRVRANASKFNRPIVEEVHRVIVHGVLHLVGYNDKSAGEKKEMREKEEAYLSLR